MFYKEIERVFRQNLENRFMDGIYLPEMFIESIKQLEILERIIIVTGFIVKEAMAGETDGPPGALILAQSLESLGKEVTLVTDEINKSLLIGGRNLLNLKADVVIVTDDSVIEKTMVLLEKPKGLGLVAIERPSRAKDNECYSMRGEVLTPYVPNTDFLFEYARDKGIPTIAIGDGGNEVGMDVVRTYVEEHVPKGKQICATTAVDYLIVGGTSNWAAYGLCSGLSIHTGKNLLHDETIEKKLLMKLNELGAVDGMEKKPILKVDGIAFNDNAAVIASLNKIIENYL